MKPDRPNRMIEQRRISRRRLLDLLNRIPELLSQEERDEILFLENQILWSKSHKKQPADGENQNP